MSASRPVFDMDTVTSAHVTFAVTAVDPELTVVHVSCTSMVDIRKNSIPVPVSSVVERPGVSVTLTELSFAIPYSTSVV